MLRRHAHTAEHGSKSDLCQSVPNSCAMHTSMEILLHSLALISNNSGQIGKDDGMKHLYRQSWHLSPQLADMQNIARVQLLLVLEMSDVRVCVPQRCDFPKRHSILVLHAASRNSPKAGHRHPALERHPASPLAGQIPGEEPVVEAAVQPAHPARLSAQCLR